MIKRTATGKGSEIFGGENCFFLFDAEKDGAAIGTCNADDADEAARKFMKGLGVTGTLESGKRYAVRCDLGWCYSTEAFFTA